MIFTLMVSIIDGEIFMLLKERCLSRHANNKTCKADVTMMKNIYSHRVIVIVYEYEFNRESIRELTYLPVSIANIKSKCVHNLSGTI